MLFASLNLAEEADPALGWQKGWKKCEHQTGSLGRGSLHVMGGFQHYCELNHDCNILCVPSPASQWSFRHPCLGTSQIHQEYLPCQQEPPTSQGWWGVWCEQGSAHLSLISLAKPAPTGLVLPGEDLCIQEQPENKDRNLILLPPCLRLWIGPEHWSVPGSGPRPRATVSGMEGLSTSSIFLPSPSASTCSFMKNSQLDGRGERN